VRCADCGKDNRDDARFCRGCGHALPRPCAACGAELPEDAAFCDRCGVRVAAPPTPAPASYTPAHLAARIRASSAALEGERKLVTVLFADVVGSTTIAERIDPEEMRTLMDRCFGHMLEEVHRYEGTVNQFTGDGIMALFGAPLALEDAPRRAVQAALAIQQALAGCREELRDICAVDLRVRIGVHTGLVVVGRIGNDLRMDYTAIGDTTNLAARLEAIAQPGSVVVSDATHRLAGAYFETRDLGLHELKGKAEPVRVHEVLAVRPVRDRVDVVGGTGLTPLAGRARELATLAETFEDTRAGRGQVVFLVGEAGIGKSRLIYEFRRGLGDAPHAWIEGRCASYATATAFFPLVDAVRRTVGIEDRDDEETALAKIDRAVPDDLTWTRPFLRLLLSLPAGDPAVDALDAVTRRSETFRALKTLNLRAAGTQPLVVVVEDLHWIDPASEEYLAFLADSIPTARLLLLLTHRPGYRHAFGDRSYHRRVALDALSPAATAEMTGSLLGVPELPASLQELITRKAEGNPLFVEEVTKSLVEDGTLRREDGRIVLGRALADTAVPDSIHGVLMARLDRLEDAPKRALQMASVIGREFALRLLARVTEAGEHTSTLVGELRALELIYEKAAHPELAYMFKHALTHDVAYESILVQRRKQLHRTIGLAIEELYGERLAEHYETLALHFARGEDWERAFEYHRRAAAKSLDAFANRAAVEHARQALATAERLGARVPREARCELEQSIGAAGFVMSEFRASGEAFERAAALADVAGRATNLAHAGFSYVWGHAYDDSKRTTAEALALAQTHGLVAAEALARDNDCFHLVIRGELDAVERERPRLVGLAESSGDEGVLARIRANQAFALEWRGRYTDAITAEEQVLEAGQRLRLPALIILPQWFIAKAACCLGQYGRAIAVLRESIALSERVGDRAFRSRLLNTLGWVLAEVGDHAEARRYNEQAVAVARDLGDPEIISNAEINLGLNHLALGDGDRALAHATPIAAQVAVPGDPWMRWRYRLHVEDLLGRIALAQERADDALAHADDALAGARRHAAEKLVGRALELRGRALVVLDRRAEAAAALAEALGVAAAIGYPPTQWRALALLTEVARRDGRRADADAAAARARALVDGLASGVPDDLRPTLYATALAGHDRGS
jgi:class 3 adenylate cyclase/tetratricopeptide (TPR) repeat protein